MQDKDSIRKELLEKRDAIPPPVKGVKDRMIHDRLSSLAEFNNSAVLLFFASFRSEVDTLTLITKSLLSGKRVVLPKVDTKTHTLLLYEITDTEEMSPGYMGIPEPSVITEERAFDINSVDAIIIPGAGFDVQGNRIGYGGGYYDRLLSGLKRKVPVIAPAYEEQIIGDIPAEPHDIRVSFVVTDRRTIICNRDTKYDVFETVRSIVKFNYDMGDLGRVEQVKDDIVDFFNGNYKNYQKCDTLYHNLEHTLQIIDPFSQIIDGWNRTGQVPRISFEYFELGLIAVLLHDTGYIKESWDTEGTGGKYTFVHINRSIVFAQKYLTARGFNVHEINSVSNMISCTGVATRLSGINFSSDEERICGYALGTADFIGQMSSCSYPEKLHYLYLEHKESYDYEGIEKLREKGITIFESAEDLIRKTPLFYENIVQERFREMDSVEACIKYHNPDIHNFYRTSIEKNIERLTDITIIQ